MILSKTVHASLIQLKAARAQYVEAVKQIDAAILALRRLAEQPAEDDHVTRRTSGQPNKPRTRPVVKSATRNRGRYAKAIARVLRKSIPRDLSVRQILEHLQIGGAPVTTKDPYRTVYKTLKGREDFQNNRGRWTLAGTDHTSTKGDQPEGFAANQ